MARVRGALALACLLWSSVGLGQSQADRERALEYFREGNKLFAQGDLHAAFEAFQDAWALHRSFDIACNLGRTEAELGLPVPAAEHLEYCLRTFATSGKHGLRDTERRFQELFDRVRAEVCGVTVMSRPLASEVLIDGASMGVGPFDHELFVAPGQHEVVVRAAGYGQRQVVINAGAGGSETIDIRLEPEVKQSAPRASAAPAAAGSAAAPSYRRPSGPEPRTLALAAGGGLTLIGLGLGLGFTLDARSAAEETDRLREDLGDACSVGSSSSACARYRDSLDHEKTSRAIANVALASGGIVGAATVGLWLVLPERAAERVAGLRPWVGAGSGGVTVRGSY